MRSVDAEELKNQLGKEMEEKVGAFEKKYERTINIYQKNADGVQKRQQQVERESATVERRGEVLKREPVTERTIREVQKSKNELRQQREQQ